MPVFINSCDFALAASLITGGVAASLLKLLYTIMQLQPAGQAGELSDTPHHLYDFVRKRRENDMGEYGGIVLMNRAKGQRSYTL